MTTQPHAPSDARARATRIAMIVAAVLGVLGVALLAFLPVLVRDDDGAATHESATILAQHGAGAVVLMAVVLACVCAPLLLHGQAQRVCTYVAAVVLLLAAILGVFGAGILILPAGIAMLVAALLVKLPIGPGTER